MATVTGFQRGNLVFTGGEAGAGNVYKTNLYTPSNASPMRMIMQVLQFVLVQVVQRYRKWLAVSQYSRTALPRIL